MITRPHLLGVASALSLALVGLTTTSAQAATSWTWAADTHIGSAIGSLSSGSTAELVCSSAGSTMWQSVDAKMTSTGVPCADVQVIGVRLDSGNVDLSRLTPAVAPNLAGALISAEKAIGSPGPDHLVGARGTAATLDGRAGTDFLVNGAVVQGGDGDDNLVYGEIYLPVGTATVSENTGDAFNALRQAHAVGSTLDGGNGRDQLIFGLKNVSHDAFTVTDSNVLFTSDQWSMTAPQPIRSIERIAFTSLSDSATINATSSTRSIDIDADATGVTLRSGAGDDFARVRAGSLSGGAGADTIVASGSLPSTLDGGPGQDRLTGGIGGDTIQAKDGEIDTVDCGGGADTAYVDANDVVKNCERINPTPETGPVGGKARLYQRTHYATRIVRVALPAVATDQRLECRLDGRAWAPCAGRFALRPRALKRGRHVLAVRAGIYDLLDPTPSTYRFQVKR